MKDIKDVLTGFDAINYFLNKDNAVDDREMVWKMGSYKKSIRRHLLSIVPSLIFVILLGIMLLLILSYSPNIIEDIGFIIPIMAVIFILIYFILLDFDKFRIKHDKFIKGNVVGTSKDTEGVKGKFYLIFMIDNKDLIAAQVSKKDYLTTKPNSEYLIFLEAKGLYAVKFQK